MSDYLNTHARRGSALVAILTANVMLPQMSRGYPIANHKPSAVPLYRVTDSGLDFEGTGTLIHYREQPLLISCAHCFDRGGEHTILVGGNRGFAIDRPVTVTQLPNGVTRNCDPVDFAVASLTANEVANLSERLVFVPEGAMEGPVVDDDWSDDFGVFGFPARDNHADMTSLTLDANAIELPAKKARKFRDRRTQKNPTWYLPLEFEPRRIEKNVRTDFVIPKPEGLSGSPIFRYTHNSRSLAGMVIEHHPKSRVLLGIRSSVIRNLLDHWWPRITQVAAS